jgi:hypothetical protein
MFRPHTAIFKSYNILSRTPEQMMIMSEVTGTIMTNVMAMMIQMMIMSEVTNDGNE